MLPVTDSIQYATILLRYALGAMALAGRRRAKR